MTGPFTCQTRTAMPVEVYIGGAGDLVICQEWTTPLREEFPRLVIPINDAESLAKAILQTVGGRS